MRHSYVLPLGVLAVILAFCMWNARSMTGCTDRWSNLTGSSICENCKKRKCE